MATYEQKVENTRAIIADASIESLRRARPHWISLGQHRIVALIDAELERRDA